MIGVLMMACVAPLPAEEEGVPYVSAAELWEEDAFESGTWVVLDEVLVSSPRAESAFYVQDRGGGPNSGARIELSGALNNWPVAMGTPVRVYGPVYVGASGPILQLRDAVNAVEIGPVEALSVVGWHEDPALNFALVQAVDVRITSDVDPTGRADATGLGFAMDFGVSPPGYNREGEATGILREGRLSLRQPSDWTGDPVGDPPVSTTVEAIRGGEVAEGTPVVLDEMVQIAPWSRGGQWTVIQEASGAGLWVDAEAWGVSGAEGDQGTWVGEVRDVNGGLRLRTWTDPTVFGAASPLDGDGDDGDRVRASLVGLDGPDAYGEWHANGWIVDDRFLSLDDLEDGSEVLGVVRDDGTSDAPRLAVTDLEPQ